MSVHLLVLVLSKSDVSEVYQQNLTAAVGTLIATLIALKNHLFCLNVNTEADKYYNIYTNKAIVLI